MKMDVILWILGFIIALWAIILLLDRYFDLKSRGLEAGPGVLIWRTKYGLGLLDRVANSSRKFWKIFGIVGAALGSVFMILVFLNLADKAAGIIGTIISPPPAGGGGAPGVMPLVPGWTFPVELIIPFLIAIGTVLIVHEPAHGITARRVGLPVESTGLLLLAVIPGAFVEPNEEELKKASISNRLQVYGAGSFANILFGILCLGLILALISPSSGLHVAGVYENTPARENIQPGMRLMEIGYVGDTSIKIMGYQDFDNFMENTRPGDNVRVITESGDHTFTLRSYPSGENLTLFLENDNTEVTFENRDNENVGFLGVWTPYYPVSKSKIAGDIFTSLIMFWETPSLRGGGISQYSYDYRAPVFIINVLQMMFLLNIGIGLFNLLPLKPLDGGHIAECLSEKMSSKKTAKRVALALSVITLAIIMINLSVWIM